MSTVIPTPPPIQHPLSLVLKLKTGKGNEVNTDEINLGTSLPDILHFAWVISLAKLGLPTSILLSTVYDGDFDVYLDKFIDSSHEAFDKIFPLIEDGPKTPVLEHRQSFHDYVRKNNIGPLPTFFSAYPTMAVADILNC
jgi:hypothetical protein